MKTKQNKIFAVMIILTAITAFSSCKKEQVNSPIKTKTDLTWVDNTYNGMLSMTLSVGNRGSFKMEDADAIPGAIITEDTLSMPRTRTIDYGAGCVGNDGKTYKGQIALTYTDNDFLHTPGATVIVIPTNYSVDDNVITGTSTLQNNGINGNGNITFTYDIEAKREFANNIGIDSLIGQQIIEWISGSGTSDKTDDEFSFTGELSGHAVEGGNLDFTIHVLQPLIKSRALGCNQVYIKGIKVTYISGQSERYLDYGDGTCDNIGIETVDDVSTTVTVVD